MRRSEWSHGERAEEQLVELVVRAREVGYLVLRFPEGGDGAALEWSVVEPWTRSRAVTVADVTGDLASPALDVALCSDLVYLRPRVRLRLSTSPSAPSDGVIWALGRAGRAALARGLLAEGDVVDAEAVALGLANGIVDSEEPVPLPTAYSVASLTAARDLMRVAAHGSAGLALELASFRLLFASGHPNEGALAFLGKRDPRF